MDKAVFTNREVDLNFSSNIVVICNLAYKITDNIVVIRNLSDKIL